MKNLHLRVEHNVDEDSLVELIAHAIENRGHSPSDFQTRKAILGYVRDRLYVGGEGAFDFAGRDVEDETVVRAKAIVKHVFGPGAK